MAVASRGRRRAHRYGDRRHGPPRPRTV